MYAFFFILLGAKIFEMKGKSISLFFFLLFSFLACDRKAKPTRTDTMTSGVASMVCDGCFAPIINEEIAVFQGINPDADMNPVYADEVTALNLLLKDSIRLVVAARDLTPAEYEYLKSKDLYPRANKIAVDGIALIINKKNNDSLISLSTLKKVLCGDVRGWKDLNPTSSLGEIKVVFDHPNSSTVRFIKDSICGKCALSDNVKAVENNQEVIDFVSKTPGALGVVGVSWVNNPQDTTNLSFIDQIRVMSVSPYDEAREDNSYQPFAAYLALRKYPLIRDVYMITSDLPGGLPAGFLHFVSGDRGQRIILKEGLVPATRPMRLVTVKSSF